MDTLVKPEPNNKKFGRTQKWAAGACGIVMGTVVLPAFVTLGVALMAEDMTSALAVIDKLALFAGGVGLASIAIVVTNGAAIKGLKALSNGPQA